MFISVFLAPLLVFWFFGFFLFFQILDLLALAGLRELRKAQFSDSDSLVSLLAGTSPWAPLLGPQHLGPSDGVDVLAKGKSWM